MRTAFQLILLTILPLGLPRAEAGSPDSKPVAATVESTLETSSRQIRQLAFDGDPETYFASVGNPGAADHFTLALDQPVVLKSIEVTTGKPDGTEKLEAGGLEVSNDGQTYEEVARFQDGVARFEPKDRILKSIRIKPASASAHPLVIREITLASMEPVARFAYPIEVVVDVTDAPEMKEWAEKAARLCERWYPRINEELKSDGFKPATQITMTLKSDYRGVAEASGNRIKGSVTFFKAHPDDLGAMIHETCHVVQRYRGRGNPGWLVEGVADYVRFFVFEPGKAGPVNPDRARYNGSYRTTAAFLAFVAEKYDKGLVLKLNKLMREGHYKEEAFKDLTGKTVQELDEEWRMSLRQ
jgi:Peptidase of plants and bacteria/F5/8 type C domain